MVFDLPQKRVLLTGATGFLGRHVVPSLEVAGWTVRCGSRRPRQNAALPTREWTICDVDDKDSLEPALEGCDAAVYLVHGLKNGGDYDEREREGAARFSAAAAHVGVRRIVYVGGVAPVGHPSRHLRSRLATGRALRASGVSTIELRAGLIIGAGGESWNIVRDLAVRLPLLPDAPWLASQLEPVAVQDVAEAVVRALSMGDEASAVYGLPGPQRMSARSLVERVALLAGRRPRWVPMPLLPLAVAARAMPMFTRAHARVSRELIEGLRADLISQTPSFWSLLDDVSLQPMDTAARRALAEDLITLPLRTRALEGLLDLATPWARSSATSGSTA